MDSVPDWLLVETLGLGSEPTVVADGDRCREWAGLVRVPREPAGTVGRIMQVVRQCVASGDTESCADTGVFVIGVPVLCAFGGVHGVQVWAGPPGAALPPRRGVAAWDWDADTELAQHGPGLEELVWARAAQDVRVTRTPPEVFSRMVRFDDRLAYVDMVGAMAPDGRWQGEVEMRGDDEVVRTFQMITRSNPVVRRVQALMHEITDVRPPRPDIELSMRRAVARRTTAGVGFIELRLAQIYEWTAPPPEPLHRWTTELPRIHPDDAADLRRACADLLRDAPADTVRKLRMRVRFDGTDWIGVRAELVRTVADGPGEPGHGVIRVWPQPPG